MTYKRVLVTGATGFVGRAVFDAAVQHGHRPVAAVRDNGQSKAFGVVAVVGPIDGDTDWTHALAACECVIHLAARVHVMAETSSDPLGEFRRTNVEATLNLARQAAASGVQRFVYVSSVKVHGEKTLPGFAFRATDPYAPTDPYAISKMEAELALVQWAETSGLELVIVRPPLVYGPGVKANFAALVNAVKRGLPIPLGAVTHNRRSLVALDNLVDLLIRCLIHPRAAGGCFMVADGEDVSTSRLVFQIGQALGRPARLWFVPIVVLRVVARLVGRSSAIDRLCDSLQIDIQPTRDILGWTPPSSLDNALRKLTANP